MQSPCRFRISRMSVTPRRMGVATPDTSIGKDKGWFDVIAFVTIAAKVARSRAGGAAPGNLLTPGASRDSTVMTPVGARAGSAASYKQRQFASGFPATIGDLAQKFAR